MPRRKIVVLQDDDVWNRFLTEAFDDTPSTLEIVHTSEEAILLFRQGNPDVVFANPALLTRPLFAALQTHRTTNPEFRAFRIGSHFEAKLSYPFDEVFESVPSTLYDFHKRLIEHLALRDPIRLLVVDDERGVLEMFRDYFDHRTKPGFIVETASDGNEAYYQIKKRLPDVMVLDIKMPHKDGRVLYRDLKQENSLPPTIVFFDLFSAEEVLDIRKWGNPAFVEKGAQESSMPCMAALIKKLAYFG